MSGHPDRKAFEPFQLGPVRLKNRIIRSATHEGMGRQDGMPTDELFPLYETIAAGGAGAIITGYMGVLPSGRTFPNMRMFDDDRYIDVYGRMNERLRQYGAPVIVQLAHGGSHAERRLTGRDVVAPGLRKRSEEGDVCRNGDEKQIEAVINAFVDAVGRARQAGFDGAQLHAAHGYLLSEFLSPSLNRRRDRWGGPVENRVRIITEILRRARSAAGGFPLLVKMSVGDEHRRGLTAQDATAVVRALRDAGCDAVEVSCGYGDVFHTVRVPRVPIDAILHLVPGYRSLPPVRKGVARIALHCWKPSALPLHNYNLDAAARIKESAGLPVIAVGGIRDLRDIEAALGERNIDCVSLSRPFVIEPDIVERFRTGGQERSRCIDCGYCLIGVTSAPLRCYFGKVPAGSG